MDKFIKSLFELLTDQGQLLRYASEIPALIKYLTLQLVELLTFYLCCKLIKGMRTVCIIMFIF